MPSCDLDGRRASTNRMRVRVFHHDRCFDGSCSASLFTRFYRECVNPQADFEYKGLLHRAGALFDEREFTGDENAIVDFKYSPSDKITWWFDHHLSAFLTAEDQQHYLSGAKDKKFYDPNYRSCTSWIAHVATQKFGFDASPVEELVKWADIVDAALFESAEAAVEMRDPAMKLTLAIEATPDPTFLPRLIPDLAYRSLNQTLASPLVQSVLPPLLARHRESIDIMRRHSECKDRTIYFDVTAYDLEGYNKFVPYYLHPESTYSVGLSGSTFRTKVSVGSNPWTTTPDAEMVNLAAICERYGGGGHARVGAISFPPDRADQARAAAAEIVAELREAGRRGASTRS
ncbi:MAG: hypothetical protein NVS9B15_18720 [Acidobacteriaceae bacterium]